jgi:hypothetical protein
MFKRFASPLLIALLAACASAPKIDAIRRDSGELQRMTYDQRLDYLAESYRYLAQYADDRPAANDIIRYAIYPTYLTMIRQDDAYRAAAIYAVTLAGPGQPTDRKLVPAWLQSVRAAAERDPDLIASISSHHLTQPAYQNADVSNGGDFSSAVEHDLREKLAQAAGHGDANACEALAGDTKELADSLISACLSSGVKSRSAYQQEVNWRTGEQQAKALGERRATELKRLQVADAGAVAKRCAQAGVTDPMMERAIASGQAYERAREWARSSMQIEYSPSNSAAFIDDYARVSRLREEGQIVTGGGAITPTLTPMLFQLVAKPLCGLSR